MATIGKSTRILILQNLLLNGKAVNIISYATDCNVSDRTAKRDIDELRAFYSELRTQTGVAYEIVYDKDSKGYILTKI